ncbi:hypothetical protein [Bacillus cereus]|uniref:hypothetical protein n=1 Tax=Bacillus cereus TaxID=1396 RepID=UPI0009B57237|nr:hypothetical protein [Bacillus cereus]
MYFFIFAVFKILVNVILIGLILWLSIASTKIETFLNNNLFIRISKKIRNIIIMIFVMLIEIVALFIISLNWKVSFIDALFIGSCVLLSYIWLVPYFVNYQQNIARVTDKHFSGNVDLGEVKVYQAKFTPFSLGSTLLSIIGIIINICYYYKYFL